MGDHAATRLRYSRPDLNGFLSRGYEATPFDANPLRAIMTFHRITSCGIGDTTQLRDCGGRVIRSQQASGRHAPPNAENLHKRFFADCSVPLLLFTKTLISTRNIVYVEQKVKIYRFREVDSRYGKHLLTHTLEEAAMPHLPCFGINRNPTRLFAPDDVMSGNPWAEFEEELTRLDAVITDINISGSDPTLQVRASNGVNWTIELGDRSRNRQAGLEDASAIIGDPVSVTGRQTHHFSENRIKAIELTINNLDYKLYPEEWNRGF
ncbi:hypothetical protein [Paracoccus onubensis]|nr:hypothetical protein [Paracoccus onubensis]